MIVDVSMYQPGLVLDSLPDTVTGVIVKATQKLYEDPGFRFFVDQVRGSTRWKYVGWYHFLSDANPDQEASHFLATLNSIGGLRPGEFAVMDWESNGYTGYRPPQQDAVVFMQHVTAALPGRVAWYSFQSMAAPARQSGELPWPLWLSDPNPDGPQWAQTLNAFLLQFGQQSLAGMTIDVNDIIDISVLDALTGEDDMTLVELAAALGPTARLNNGILEIEDVDGRWYPFAAYLQYIHTEAKAAHDKPASSGSAPAPFTIVLSGTATPT